MKYCHFHAYIFVFFCNFSKDKSRADFIERKSELVSGFNIGYFSVEFTLIFIAKYGIIFFVILFY